MNPQFKSVEDFPLIRNLQQKGLDLNSDNTVLTAIIKEMPTKKVTKSYLKKFRNQILEELKALKPKYIIVFGTYPAEILLQDSKMARAKNTSIYSEGLDAMIILLHPWKYYIENEVMYNEMLDLLPSLCVQTKPVQVETKLLLTASEVEKVLDKALQAERIGLDVETSTFEIWKGFKFLSVALYIDDVAYAFPIDLKLQGQPLIVEQGYKEMLKKKFTQLFLSPDVLKIGHNIKFDIQVLRKYFGIPQIVNFNDTMLMHYLIDETNETHSLESLLGYINFANYKTIEWDKKMYQTGDFPSEYEVKEFLRYNAMDAAATYRLYDVLLPQLTQKQQVLNKVLCRLSLVLADMEMQGMRVSIDTLTRLKQEYEKRITEIEQRLQAYPEVQKAKEQLGIEQINLRSTHQLQEVFKCGNYPILKTTETGKISTDSKTLRRLAEQYDIAFAKDLYEYREAVKLYTSFIVPYLEGDKLIKHGENDFRIHTSYHITATVSGRLSSSNPNLQQIPKSLRVIFIPLKEDHILVNADYSQMELRVLAMLTRDPHLCYAYQKGIDLHKYTASLIFNKPMDQVTDEERKKAKTVNFGIAYGITAKGLAEQLNISEKDAQKLIDTWFQTHSRVWATRKIILEKTKENLYVETPFGRRRHIPEIVSDNGSIRARAERQAFNFLIQSTAAEFTFLSLIRIYKWLQNTKYDVALVNTVHDSIVLSVHKDHLDPVIRQIKYFMENYNYKFMNDIPLLAEFEIGTNWCEMKEYSLEGE